jgi:nicotinamide-nucleotide amidase
MKVSILALQYIQKIDCEQQISKLIDLLTKNGIEINAVTKAKFSEEDLLIYLKYLSSISSYIIIFNADKKAKQTLGASESDIYFSYNSSDIAFIDMDNGIALFENMVLPVILSKSITHRYKYILRTYGLDTERAKELIKDVSRAKARVSIEFIQTRSLCDIEIGYTDNMSGIEVINIVNEIKKILKDYLYEEGTVSISKKALDLLREKQRKLSIAESYTGGHIVSELVKNAGASTVLYEGLVTYTDRAKMLRLDVEKETIEKDGAVSSETAYQMAAGLIKAGADIAMATTGFAGPEGDNVGLCYLALGDKNGIHIFENHFLGSRSDIILQGCDNAFFKLIKYLNDEHEK